MSNRLRLRWCYFPLLAGLVLLSGGGATERRPARAFEAAPFSPDQPPVAALRHTARTANVVICVIDAARADHLGCYGYSRDTTPNLDRLARQSVRFTSHFCQYVSTKPSTASLFTSQHSDTHLVTGTRNLQEDTFTMSEGLAAAGFRTVLFSSNPNASPGASIGLDFHETYDQTDVEPFVESWEDFTSPEPLLTLIRSWLDRHRRSRFFAYVHFDPPHQPYRQPDRMTALFAGQQPPAFSPGDFVFPVGDRKLLATSLHPPLPEWINLYDANLRYADWAVGELERALRQEGLLDNTLFIVTADHGEAFGEHGYLWHERGVYEELARVPLLIRFPGGARPTPEIAALTQSIDLLPTIFDTLQVPYPAHGLQGRSLLPLIAGLVDRVHDHVLCRSDGRPPSYLLRTPRWALILYGNGEWRELYDLEADPGQTTNVIARHPEVAAELLEAFRAFALAQRRPPVDFLHPEAEPPPMPPAEQTEPTPEVRRRLRALGYVD